MGELKTQLFNMLKFAFVVCCAALAAAEPEAKADADPALLYGAYGAYGAYDYGLPYAGYGYGAYPYAYYGKRSADAEPKADADAYYYGAYGLGYGYAGPYAYGAYAYGKRSADAEPKADADAYYYGAYGLGYAGYGYGLG